MITINKAVDILKKRFPNSEINRAAFYKDGYLFVAPDKNLGILRDVNDPYYLINKNTGKISRFFPMNDMNGFQDAFNNHEIKDLRKE